MKLRLVHVPLVIGICAAAAAGIGGRAGAQAHTTPDIARGRHIATALTGCAACHGANFAGGRAFGPPGPGAIRSANLTGGAGGVGAVSDADLVRAIRTGIAPDGTHLRVMPSEEYAVMTDADVADVVAFLRSVPPVDNVIVRAPVPDAPPAASSPAEAVTAAPAVALTGGAYLARIGGCTSCHGAALTGAVAPGNVAAPNISHTGIGAWTFAGFTTAMRTGKTPDGRTLSPAMPWDTFGNMTDAELHDVYTYLQSQPERAN